MKVAILHLSDLHIEKENSQWMLKRAEQIVTAVRNDFSECAKIIILVTGDIANAGTEEEYGYAKQFFRTLLREFAFRGLNGTELENKIICVPGNHDCDFSREEVQLAKDNGFIPVSLGDARLRTETAAVVACHTVNLINQMK